MSALRAATATGIEGMGEADSSAPQQLPRVLIFTTALTCGVLLALAVNIALNAAGVGLASLGRELFPTHQDQLKSALAWWAICLAGCIGSWAVILLLRSTSTGKSAQRLRLGLAIAFFCLLAAAGHEAAPVAGLGTATITAVNLAAVGLGAFMAFCTVHFALRR